MQGIRLESDQLVIVPGNHDLNWEVSKNKGYQLIDRDNLKGEPDPVDFIKVSDDVIRLANAQKIAHQTAIKKMGPVQTALF